MRKMEKIHLTQFAKHGGCAAKIGPDTLWESAWEASEVS